MSCRLCGHEETHHLGCVLAVRPDLADEDLFRFGFMAKPAEVTVPDEHVEVLKEGSMTTVPEEAGEVGLCEFGDCQNAKYSNHSRVKFCNEHRDPKNRKE